MTAEEIMNCPLTVQPHYSLNENQEELKLLITFSSTELLYSGRLLKHKVKALHCFHYVCIRAVRNVDFNIDSELETVSTLPVQFQYHVRVLVGSDRERARTRYCADTDRSGAVTLAP